MRHTRHDISEQLKISVEFRKLVKDLDNYRWPKFTVTSADSTFLFFLSFSILWENCERFHCSDDSLTGYTFLSLKFIQQKIYPLAICKFIYEVTNLLTFVSLKILFFPLGYPGHYSKPLQQPWLALMAII